MKIEFCCEEMRREWCAGCWSPLGGNNAIINTNSWTVTSTCPNCGAKIEITVKEKNG